MTSNSGQKQVDVESLLNFSDDRSGNLSPRSVFDGLLIGDSSKTVGEGLKLQTQHYHHPSENILFTKSVDSYNAKRLFEEDGSQEDGAESIQHSTGSSTMNLFPTASSEEPDFDFVKEYDNAFNKFLLQNPEFDYVNPDLTQKLRLLKLKKILEGQVEEEAVYVTVLQGTIDSKKRMLLDMQERLRNSVHEKAVRETYLQSYLGSIHYETKTIEAQLTWKLILDTESSIKRLREMSNEKKKEEEEKIIKSKANTAESDVNHHRSVDDNNRFSLLEMLAGDENFDSIRNAALAPAGQELSIEQRKDLRQFRADNLILRRKIDELQKRLDRKKVTSKNHSWVESSLLRMDESSIQTVRKRFKKKAGVPLSSSSR